MKANNAAAEATMPADLSPSSLLNATRIAAQLAVGEQPTCPPGYCAGLATCGDRHCHRHPCREKTGWPAPELAQDDHRPLFRWFAGKPDARRLVCERVAEIEADTPLTTPEEAEGWTASVGYYLIAALAFIAFVIFTLMVAASTKGF